MANVAEYFKYEFEIAQRFSQSKDESFRRGVIAGITAFATWKNGEQVVGIQQHPLRSVIEDINNTLK